MNDALETPSTLSRGHRAIAIWLLVVAGLVFAMVLVGGATRLTDSGLSITEWKPVTGVIPPLSSEAWEEEFEKYRQIPEYELVNQGMSLSEFKSIYFWEWGHRLLGRLIGLAFFVPFIWFLFRRAVERERLPRLIVLFLLGGSQGVLGWYMVMSGLAIRVDVSQYRLAAHLTLAIIIYGALLWTALDYLRGTWGFARPQKGVLAFSICAALLLGTLLDQIFMGGIVAGLDAGLIYNTWPLTDGALIPQGLFSQSPWLANLFESHLTAQFTHRGLAYLIVLGGVGLWLWARALELSFRTRKALNMVLAMILVQVALGIWTLLAVVPMSLALIHQAGAVLTLSGGIYLCHILWAQRQQARER